MESMHEVISKEALRNLIGADFIAYCHDPLEITRSVYEIVGLYIGDKRYALTNKLEDREYYSRLDDISVLRFSEVLKIQSSLADVTQVLIPVHSRILKILLINEHQIVYKGDKKDFEGWLTRALLFYLEDNHEIMFEKENWVYSDRIIPYKGRNLLEKLSSPDDFTMGWEEINLRGECEREFLEIK